MRYRQMTAEDDYRFGYGTHFLADSSEAVAQAIKTRMRLYAREWFLDDREGLDLDAVLGYGTQNTRDREVQQRILGTQGVLQIAAYSSQVSNRKFNVTATVDTIYGQININEAL